MTSEKRSAIIISASSDIGAAMSRRWKGRGWNVIGTYRTESDLTRELQRDGMKLIHCDLSNSKSVQEACAGLQALCPQWDILVLCPGRLEPIGNFLQSQFDPWEESMKINFTNQIRIVRQLLPGRRTSSPQGPYVLFFAGGGTNDAPVNYSAYTVSKIALIKMCELLDAEIPDTSFVIIGPGWVKTKIHDATLKAGSRAGRSYQKTLEKLSGGDFTPPERIIDCFDWIITQNRDLVSGRNFSVRYDSWGSDELVKRLRKDSNLFKLRRYGNEG
jgi:NAD(P)-dependent dehydrogenase (short-subunit alcohol dehydrogenase family)